MFKKLCFYAISLMITLFASILLLELAARILFEDNSYNVHPFSEFQHDPLLGWKGIPNYHGVSRLSKSRIDINSNGFRDPDWNEMLDRASKAGLWKIMVLGDSNVYGYEIERYERFTEQLQRLFESNGRDVAIFNLGIPAFGTDQEYRAFEIYSPTINPNIVLLRWSGNDIGDSALPYCWGDPKYRVYRPFYDTNGKLVLNEKVPKRFSLRVKETVLDNFRLKFAIDRIESLIDDIGYSRRGISENRRIKVQNRSKNEAGWSRHVWDMGCVGTHPGFRDIYDQNKIRNFNLIKKLDAFCKQREIAFMVLTSFDGHPDPSHPHQELISFLDKNSIRHVNVAKNHPYVHWGYVNYDGHPNFLTNYYAAINIYDAIVGKNVPIDFSATEWFGDLARKIDFAKGDYHKYLFGGKWGKTKTIQGKRGRWLNGSARFLLRGRLQSRQHEIYISGINSSDYNIVELSEEDCEKISLDRIELGKFNITGKLQCTNSTGLHFFELRPKHPLFIQSIGIR